METPDFPTVEEPYPLGHDAYLIPAYYHAPGAPVGVHLNSLVLRSAEPTLFDTGVAAYRDAWMESAFSVVEPEDVRWIVCTHEDADHVGNVAAAMEACPNATMVSTWFLSERMQPGFPVPPTRQRWVGPGETLEVGDRTLRFVRPPLYDAPTTRVVHDGSTGLLWAADLFATTLEQPTNDAADVPADFLADGIAQSQQYNSPWYELIDRSRYDHEVAALERLGITTIASTHGPAFRGAEAVAQAFQLLREVPDREVAPQPGQAQLEEIVAQIAG